jgi:hypothetical protein
LARAVSRIWCLFALLAQDIHSRLAAFSSEQGLVFPQEAHIAPANTSTGQTWSSGQIPGDPSSPTGKQTLSGAGVSASGGRRSRGLD